MLEQRVKELSWWNHSSPPKPAYITDATEVAQGIHAHLEQTLPGVGLEEADVLVVLGGDGFMLKTLHQDYSRKLPVYGFNCGTVGFLLNNHPPENLFPKLLEATPVDLHPLKMQVTDMEGQVHQDLAINEVSLLRSTHQTAKIRIWVDNVVRMQELVCDGVILSTAAGSTAYNLSAHGPILPLESELLALTPISAFRPRCWRGALLPNKAQVRFEICEPDKRPVSAVADYTEVRNARKVEIMEDRSITYTLLFHPDHNLEERILGEQFRG